VHEQRLAVCPATTVTGPLRVVALGGGHGLGASLRALRRAFPDAGQATVTAVVTVADNGGSSGRLREEFPGALPPGDLRMALAALCPEDSPWVPLLHHRFHSAGSLNGHAVGNLLLLGAAAEAGDEVAALGAVGELIGARGRVLPMSSVPLDIEAHVALPDGTRSTLHGQAAVAKPAGRILGLRLHPLRPPACPEAVEAIMGADAVLLGPGSWFTSVLVHLLVPGLAAALVETPARVVIALNTEADRETAGLAAADHLTLLRDTAPTLRADTVIADTSVTGRVDGRSRAAIEAATAALGARLVIEDIARRRPDGSSAGTHDPDGFAAVLRAVLGAPVKPLA
jgi:uncharacterized cofD-like protein